MVIDVNMFEVAIYTITDLFIQDIQFRGIYNLFLLAQHFWWKFRTLSFHSSILSPIGTSCKQYAFTKEKKKKVNMNKVKENNRQRIQSKQIVWF